MKKIEPEHLRKFYALLATVSQKFPLDIHNIKSVIEGKGKSSFQDGERCSIILAVPDEISKTCSPYMPVVSVTSPGNHISEHIGVLELKIMDTRKKHAGLNFIAWLSMTPTGRLIFGMEGVNLDSNGKKISVDEEIARRDHKFFNDHKLIRDLRTVMVEAFTSTEESANTGKQKLLEVFREVLPANN